MEYDEEAVIVDYVWQHGWPLMTRLEALGVKAVHAREKSENSSGVMAKKIIEKWGSENNPEVVAALSKGTQQFKIAVKNRVLSDNPDFVKRCPHCNKVLRTPLAKQCRWCFKSWR